MGLASRRRYRWTRGRITDYWDEVFDPDRLDEAAALDDQSARQRHQVVTLARSHARSRLVHQKH